MKSQNPQKLYDKNPVVYIQPTGLIKKQFSCSLLIAHSQGHLDRKILRPQWDLIAPRKNPFSLQIKQHISLIIPHGPAQDSSASSWRQLDSAKLLTMILVSEAKFQKREGASSLREGRECYRGTRRQKPKFLRGVEGWKEEETTCQNHSARHKANLGEEIQALKSTEN